PALAAACACLAPAGALAAAPCQGPPMPGGEWPSYGHDPANTRTQPAEHELGPAAAPGLTAAWTFSTASAGDSSSAFDSTPVVAGGCVFAASTGGYVYALDAATGRKVWQSHVAVATAGLGGTFVGAPALRGHTVIYLVDAQDAPYAIAFDRSTGAVVWRSDPVVAKAGYYTNASAIVANGLLFFGYSAPEGDPHGVGGFGLLDADSGAIVKVTPTIPQSDQDKGYAGGGLWSTPAYDPGTKYAYIGAGNPSSKRWSTRTPTRSSRSTSTARARRSARSSPPTRAIPTSTTRRCSRPARARRARHPTTRASPTRSTTPRAGSSTSTSARPRTS
ncbi:MAG: outer membrane protein assembly factor BamB family protein, partial [Solirubrobacteraceae bacterium]